MKPQAIRIAAVSAIALVLDASVAPHTAVFGVKPQLILAVVLAIALGVGAREAAVVGFVAGLVIDAVDGIPLGITAFAYVVTASAVAFAGEHSNDVAWVRLLLAGFGSVLGVVVTAIGANVLGMSDIGVLVVIKISIVVGVINAVLASLLVRALHIDRMRKVAW